jgi:acyl transferase domain-containing protein
MFSGQGTQYYQMAKDLYEHHPVFRKTMDEGDEIAKTILRSSIVSEIFRYPLAKNFDDLIISSTALVLVQYSFFRTLLSEGIQPDYVWGSSIGEIVAAAAANVFDLETALLLAAEQAKLIVQRCRKGGMVAVFADASFYDTSEELKRNTTLAGINFPKGFVISGEAKQLELVVEHLNDQDITHQRLPVNYGFHSHYIDEFIEPFSKFCLNLQTFRAPGVPFLSSARAKILYEIDQCYFPYVARGPIQFYEMFRQFNRIKDNGIFIDCSPSGTLATCIKYASVSNGGSLSQFSVLSPFGDAMRRLALLKESLASC